MLESLVASQCILGEGPLWNQSTHEVFWVDIKSKRLYCYNTLTEKLSHWTFPTALTSIVSRERGGYFGTSEQGFVEVDLSTGELLLIGGPEVNWHSNRHNDAKVDPFGNLWSGTMDNNEQLQTGHLYRLDKSLNWLKKASDYFITNGPTFSCDGKFLYHTDTILGHVYRYKLSDEGNLSDKSLFAAFSPDEGNPDGMTTDIEGNLWICLFGGYKVIQFSPQGKRIQEVQLPCANITSCAFGGEKMDLLYITTAKWKLSEKALIEQPLAGNLFVLETKTQGLPAVKFSG